MTAIVLSRPGRRRSIAAALAVGAVLVVAGQYGVRVVEATVGARISDLLVPGVGSVRPAGGTQFTIWTGSRHEHVIDVGSVCTIAPYMAAVLLVAAGFVLWDQQVAPTRVVRACSSVCALFLAVNIIRIVVIVASVGALGLRDGLELGHHVLGTLLILAALTAGIALLARAVLSPSPNRAAP